MHHFEKKNSKNFSPRGPGERVLRAPRECFLGPRCGSRRACRTSIKRKTRCRATPAARWYTVRVVIGLCTEWSVGDRAMDALSPTVPQCTREPQPTSAGSARPSAKTPTRPASQPASQPTAKTICYQ